MDARADAFAAAAGGRGWRVECARRNLTFCRYVVIFGDERTEVDLAVDSPPLELPETVEGLPVLTSLDLGGRKVLTIVDRLEARYYTDLHAPGRHPWPTDLHRGSPLHGPRCSGERRCGRLHTVTLIRDERFPAGAEDAAAIKRYFTDWADELGAT